ncbi:MAG: hypothetical protein IPH22_05730 [Nitrosomonas sp.]|nr:hypothetical protein [Nitrosomonas sp.]
MTNRLRFYLLIVALILNQAAFAQHLDVEVWGEGNALFAGYCRTPGVVGCDLGKLAQTLELPAGAYLKNLQQESLSFWPISGIFPVVISEPRIRGFNRFKMVYYPMNWWAIAHLGRLNIGTRRYLPGGIRLTVSKSRCSADWRPVPKYSTISRNALGN